MKKIILPIVILGGLFFGCKSPEARKPVSYSSGSFIDQSVERNIKLNEKEHQQIKSIMNEHPENNYLSSESGFWYYYNTKVENDSLTTPDFGDIVNFNYSLKSLNGTTIYSEEELKTQNYAMDQQEIFTGLREGLKLMKTGETVTFFFPSQKAYGYYGDENKIGVNVPLICQVTVNSIQENNQ
ncbi:MAG: gliding motility-associated peptidyl-prolyl isomerase GldI [Flavobacteriaceae bacterium]|nr:gliding motility-associated peptidyl-prolyl isomerase GldI [Mangrovimonas sp.]MCB0433531.1 gliding motility-associated peptidyl-prolyl isomerase GldI [Mangrovimonas sp.]MCB0435873.1 gliding motility-associated peptidyl-prolyl isomerase GldI [Mangrovimonas sp.]MCB0439071.1 gliding motility-associated peptidyl-prolyl isomerase GldI [Mangrovimonas sp.]HPF96861.1 gliding motility-associated peptidyl-prolyl isomerase GldI [Mangrovimonas sp.]